MKQIQLSTNRSPNTILTNHIFQETRISVITKHYIHIDILHDHHPTYAKVDTNDM